VSRPAFDPNLFAGRIRSKDWKDLLDNPDHPLMNRAIQAQLAPGSTFKPIMALAGLETGAIDDNFHINCPGGGSFYGRFFKCWGRHGGVELHRGLVQSCDTFFYNVGNRMNIDDIAHYAEMVGYGHKTGIDLPHEAEGVVPSTRWKIRNFREKWYPGETISVSIGQGATEVTPMQIAYTIGGIASGGVFRQPHLLMNTQPAPEVDFPISESTTDFITQAMWGVVNEDGTAAASRLPGIEFCGKTGTAQVISADRKGLAGKETQTKNNAWFEGFAPRRNPEIVVVVLVQAGGFGAVSAAPIARDIVKAYYDKKQGNFQQLTTQLLPGSAPLANGGAAAARTAATKPAAPQRAVPPPKPASSPAAPADTKPVAPASPAEQAPSAIPIAEGPGETQ
jgi:penicillin-binding protein 2